MNRYLSDSQLLANSPDFIVMGSLFKASPMEEGGKRILFIEASDESEPDFQNEIVLQQALADQTDYYLKYGNIDLSHYTLMGPSKSPDGKVNPGIPNHLDYEIGKPIEVRLDGAKTYVKAELYQGDSAQAKNANTVWDSLTKQQPPKRWYASVGGAVMRDFNEVKTDPITGKRITVIKKVRWNNIALDSNPINRTVGEVSAAPMAVFAKSLNGFVMKTLDAGGYGTDVATLEGGAALRMDSVDNKPYSYWQDYIAGGIRDKSIPPRQIKQHLISLGFRDQEAEQITNQFLTDLQQHLRNRRK